MQLRRLLTVIISAALAFLSGTASALVPPCAIAPSVDWTPGHPGPADIVQLSVLPGSLVSIGYGFAVFAVEIRPDNVIFVDALWVLSSVSVEVPGYRQDPYALGPLPPGTYTAMLSMRTYDPASGATAYPCADSYSSSISVGTVAGPVGIASVVEFYNATLDHYFITQDAKEIADLDNGVHVGWERTGQAFPAYVAYQSDRRGRRVDRYYAAAPTINSHFLTGLFAESLALEYPPLVDIWRIEVFGAFEIALPDASTGECPLTTIPVYRTWNNRPDSNHRYTTDRATRDFMVARGHIAEGFGPDAVVMCAPTT